MAAQRDGSVGSGGARTGSGLTGARTGSARRDGYRLLALCAAVAFVLHTLALLWTWFSWRAMPGARGGWMVITDLPVSLLYGDSTDGRLLLWSLTLGGLQWAVTGAFVAWAAWRIAALRGRR